jgi:hypothetical protein
VQTGFMNISSRIWCWMLLSQLFMWLAKVSFESTNIIWSSLINPVENRTSVPIITAFQDPLSKVDKLGIERMILGILIRLLNPLLLWLHIHFVENLQLYKIHFDFASFLFVMVPDSRINSWVSWFIFNLQKINTDQFYKSSSLMQE